MERNKQSVEDITSSQVIQSGNGSIVVINNNTGIDPASVISVCNDLLKREIDSYTIQAAQEARNRFDALSVKLEAALQKLETTQLEKIKEPAIQIAANETYTEYIRSGEEFLGDEMIDLLIERMSVPEYTSKQVLIDEARRVIPKLTKKQVDVLAIITFIRLILPRPRMHFVKLLDKIGEFGQNINMVNAIDIAILVQSSCATDSSSIRTDYSIAPILKESYDTFFRKPVMKEQLMSMLKPYTVKERELLFQYVGYLGEEWYYKISTLNGNTHYTNILRDSGRSKILKDFDEMSQKMTLDEVENFLKGINKNWEQILYLFKKDYMKSLTISPVGNYIGWRHLCKQTGEKIDFDIFYPNR